MSSSKKNRNRIVNLELTALCVAANKAGMSYGKIMTQITADERRTIIREYERILNIERDNDTGVDLLRDTQ